MTGRRVEDTDLFWIDWDTEQWQCPRCDRWLRFDETKCMLCSVEAPDPIFQHNARKRDRKAKYTLRTQIKVGFHVLGVGFGIAGLVCFLARIPLAVVFAGVFLGYVVVVRRGKKG